MKDIDFEHLSGSFLDCPIKSACENGWREWVEVWGAVETLPASIGRFCWVRDQDPNAGNDFADLLARREEPLLLLQKGRVHVPKRELTVTSQAAVQMVLQSIPSVPDMDRIDLLQAKDAVDMLRLANLCKPGPFAIGTPRLGTFLGIREHGKLIGMAGQRMRFPGWIEVSGVCVHPDFQGAGIGARLVRAMSHLILSGGETPFLHTYKDNSSAISLYEKLGFEIRSEMLIMSVALDKEVSQ